MDKKEKINLVRYWAKSIIKMIRDGKDVKIEVKPMSECDRDIKSNALKMKKTGEIISFIIKK